MPKRPTRNPTRQALHVPADDGGEPGLAQSAHGFVQRRRLLKPELDGGAEGADGPWGAHTLGPGCGWTMQLWGAAASAHATLTFAKGRLLLDPCEMLPHATFG